MAVKDRKPICEALINVIKPGTSTKHKIWRTQGILPGSIIEARFWVAQCWPTPFLLSRISDFESFCLSLSFSGSHSAVVGDRCDTCQFGDLPAVKSAQLWQFGQERCRSGWADAGARPKQFALLGKFFRLLDCLENYFIDFFALLFVESDCRADHRLHLRIFFATDSVLFGLKMGRELASALHQSLQFPTVFGRLLMKFHRNNGFELLFKESYPSWFFPINQGATTMWERWNSYSHADGFGDANINSFNHYAYGAIGQFMYERVDGLSPDPTNPGYKHFFIRPLIGGPLASASAELETPFGKAKSSWAKSENRISINTIVPPNTTATCVIPMSHAKQIQVEGVLLNGKSLRDNGLAAKKNKTKNISVTIEPGTHHFQITFKNQR